MRAKDPTLAASAWKMMKPFCRNTVAAIVVVLASFRVAPAGAQSTHVTFLLVNDIYLIDDEVMSDGKSRGGFARLAAVVKAERAKGGHVILAHGGDTISPSMNSALDHGAHMVALTNMVAPDIFVPGNHEFDFGKATFLERMAEAKFPLYAASLRGPDGQPLPKFNDRKIIDLDGVRIGLTGATYDDSARVSSPEDLQISRTVPVIREQAQALRREHADFVVAVVHADRQQDYAIMGLRTVDLTLSGHNHDLFINYDGRNAVVESSYNAHYVTAIDVDIEVKEEDGRREVTWWPQFRVIDTATVTPDPEMAKAVALFDQQFSQSMDVPLAVSAVELDTREAAVRSEETAIGDLIADSMREAMHADVAIMNGGGIRGGKTYPPHSVLTRRDVLAELPFGNKLVTLRVRGSELRQAIENGLSRLPEPSGRFPQVSGLVVEADVDQPPGRRVTSITIGGVPLDESGTYILATNDYLARGGDGYTMLRDATKLLPISDSPLLATETMLYLQKLGTVQNGVQGRILLSK